MTAIMTASSALAIQTANMTEGVQATHSRWVSACLESAVGGYEILPSERWESSSVLESYTSCGVGIPTPPGE